MGYARLNYEISRVPKERCRDGLSEWFAQKFPARMRDREVYAVMKSGAHGLVELEQLTDRPPSGGLFLRGRCDWWGSEDQVAVRYGIEALFLPQAKARELERAAIERNTKEGRRIDAEVAVGPSGLAVLKGYRWEPLGVTLKTEVAPVSAGEVVRKGDQRPVVAVVVELKNHGDQPVAVWAPAGGAAFRLLPEVRWGETRCRWAGADRPRPKPEAADIRTLQPGESLSTRIDLAAPEWAVVCREEKGGDERRAAIPSVAERTVAGWCFQIEYTPPDPTACAGLPGGDVLWRQNLRTAVFHPMASAPDPKVQRR